MVEERELDQWFLRITAYQDELLDDMAQLTAVARARAAAAAQLDRPLAGRRGRLHGSTTATPLRVFTTRIDTIYGATFMVLAPEHPRVDELLAGNDGGDAPAMANACAARTGATRQAGQVDKEGVFTGRYATNPFSGERIPIWVGNFVLMGYGTGAIMAVPAHDQRDFEFARKYGLPVRVVIQPADGPDAARMDDTAYDGPRRAR